MIVGPSGSGKTSIGRGIFGEPALLPGAGLARRQTDRRCDRTGRDFNAVTAALAAVGLGDVPAWLRPYRVLSNGEKFRANLARIIADAPARRGGRRVHQRGRPADRQVRRPGFPEGVAPDTGRRSCSRCHYDILDWVEPDWIFDTATGKFDRRRLATATLRPRGLGDGLALLAAL